MKALLLKGAPHLNSERTTAYIMWHVCWALLPAALWGIWSFGLSALSVLVVCVGAACLADFGFTSRFHRLGSLSDGSAVITGLLLGMTLPPSVPLWMAALGSLVAIGLGKHAFGGLGQNLFNPALVGRAFLQAAFPAAMTRWTPPFLSDRFQSFLAGSWTIPFARPQLDAISGATPLGLLKFDHMSSHISDLFLGQTAGCIGETASVLVLTGGAYLALRRMLDWRIPIAVMGSVFVISGVANQLNANYPDGLFMLGSGGLMVGAWFMATDMVTSPVTTGAIWLFGVLIGFLICAIRFWGGLPEGVMYAILIANATVPLLERFTQPKAFGGQP